MYLYPQRETQSSPRSLDSQQAFAGSLGENQLSEGRAYTHTSQTYAVDRFKRDVDRSDLIRLGLLERSEYSSKGRIREVLAPLLSIIEEIEHTNSQPPTRPSTIHRPDQQAAENPANSHSTAITDDDNQDAERQQETTAERVGVSEQSTSHNSHTRSTYQAPTSATSLDGQSLPKFDPLHTVDKTRNPLGVLPIREREESLLTSSGGSGDGSSDGEPYSEENYVERISRPREYFRQLELLEESVYQHSAIFFQHSSLSEWQFDMPFPEYEILEDADPGMFDIFRDARAEGHLQEIEGFWLHLCHLRNVIFSVYLNLMRLKIHGFCGNHISLIVIDPNRPDQVAKLLPLLHSDVRRLAIAFHHAAHACVDPNEEFRAELLGLSKECGDFLDLLGLSSWARSDYESQSEDFGSDSAIWLWYSIVHTLDFAVLSYSGAHIEDFDETYLGAPRDAFEIPGPFFIPDKDEKSQSEKPPSPGICLRRRSLQCLDKFLHRKVWVFHLEAEAQNHDTLYLQTRIETFADVWGPLWKSIRKSKQDEIHELNVGNGTILPWPHNQLQGQPIITSKDEVYCHWISWREPLANRKLLQKGLVKRHLHMQDILLIGASTNPDLELKPNDDCQRSLVKIKQDLNNIDALKHLKTARRDRIKDSQTVQVSAGGMGLTAGTSTTYKRRSGQTWKDALVESWRDHPDFVNPVELEYYVGLEISLCTRNARRIRLLDVLRSKTIELYLKGRDFRWGKKLEGRYFKALRSPKAFRKLWKVRKYRKTICEAVSRCLDALAETGVDEQTGALKALWIVKAATPLSSSGSDSESDSVSEDTGSSDKGDTESGHTSSDEDLTYTEEYIMSIFRSEHTWTRFLKDTRDILTMAIVEDNCLECNQEYGRRCTSVHIAEDGKLMRWASGYPVLQTSLEINELLLNDEGIRKEEPEGERPYWDMRNVERKARFRLGDQGVLDVFENPNAILSSRKGKGKAKMRTKSTTGREPLVVEWCGVKSETLRELSDVDIQQTFYGSNPKEHHTEYSSTALPTRPLPVLILSNSTKTSPARIG
jgi:hypothetical protein